VINVWSNGRDTFSTPNTVAKFAVICVVLATPISATVGITTLVIAGYAEWANFANIWLTWWLGDMIGALVVTPVVVLCALSDARAFRRTELTKSAAVISLAVAVGFIAFNPFSSNIRNTREYIGLSCRLTAVVGRIAPRSPRHGVASFILAGFSIWGTFSGAGPFAPPASTTHFFWYCVLDQRQRSKLGTQCRCRDAKNDRGKSASNAYGIGSSGGNAHRGACCRQSSIAGRGIATCRH
jgi:Predicted integral membrane sensor domain